MSKRKSERVESEKRDWPAAGGQDGADEDLMMIPGGGPVSVEDTQVVPPTDLVLTDPPAVSPAGVVKETPEEKFVRLANQRLAKAVKAIRSIERVVARGRYARTNDQVEYILDAIRAEVEIAAESAYSGGRKSLQYSVPPI